ncbi:MAG: polysaccharide pyruvyl transferase family protein [Candidatus Gastranaerophilales bacterium]|nr:polysaccharide pyruvyl transferase family protein [Candidatus Gastranaerophilales bacterium]
MKPFFINSNIAINKKDILSYENLMSAIAGNTGNSYITYALIKTVFGKIKKLNHIQNIYNYDFSKQDVDIEKINNECSHVFLILQDQIRISESYGLQLPYENIKNFIKKLNKPVIIAGLGANSFEGFDKDFHKKLKPELIDFLKFLSDNCKKIGIRGEYTQEVLHNIGIDNTSVIGCPSYYEMGENRIIAKKENLNYKKILLTSYFPIEFLVRNYQIMQDNQEEYFIKACAYNEIDENIHEFNLNKLIQKKYKIFSNIEQWKKFVSKFDFAVGNRLHGSILSINSGTLAICCNPDSRATEMCNYLKIPHCLNLNEQNFKEIYNSIDVDLINNSYKDLYKKYLLFLEENDLKITQNIPSKEAIKLQKIKLYGFSTKAKLLKIKYKRIIKEKLSILEIKYRHLIKFIRHLYKLIIIRY